MSALKEQQHALILLFFSLFGVESMYAFLSLMIMAQLVLRQRTISKKNNNFCAGGLFGQYRFVGGWVWGRGTLRLYIHVNNSQEFSDCI